MIRQPIVSVLGHIDHGKTSLLDRIRGTAIVAKEAGGITQHIGATEIPVDTIKKVCGNLLVDLGMNLTLPGLLFIDTPGHAAFTNLRKRGGSISDIGVLIVDVNEGFKPQTYEALNILKSYKTPFMVVANKIDLMPGWQTQLDMPLLKSFNSQRPDITQDLDIKLYGLVEILYKNGFSAERFDRVKDFTNQIAVVPISAKTGEGIPEFLMVLTGLTQKYMEDQLKVDVSGPGKGSILEVKQTTGLGTTIDVILYNGSIKRGDRILVGTRDEPIDTNIKALLKPAPLEEIRIGKAFQNVDEVYAAAGIKIAAPGLDPAVAGSPVYVVSNETVEQVKDGIKQELEDIQIETEGIGVVVKADTLGSLEALVRMLKEEGIKIRKAGFGDVSKKDIAEARAVQSESVLNAVIFAFNVKVLPDAEKEAADYEIKVMSGDVVYSLLDEYKKWAKEEVEKAKAKTAETVTMPAKIRLLPGYVFRQSNPAVCGVQIMAGTLKSDVSLINEGGEVIGKVKEIQKESKNVKEATAGEQVAVSIVGATIGRHIKEGDTLYVQVTPRDIEALRTKLKDLLSPEDYELLKETEEISKVR
jgi:translation initiation factor 5B